MHERGVLPAGAPGQLGVELRVVPPAPIVRLFLFQLMVLGRPALDPGQQGLCPSPLHRFPPEALGAELVQ